MTESINLTAQVSVCRLHVAIETADGSCAVKLPEHLKESPISGLTPEQAVDIKRAIERVYLYGLRGGLGSVSSLVHHAVNGWQDGL